jgi:acyl carrier protein
MEIPSESEFMERIIETLNLDSDVEITPETLLFGGELGLNSVDALEIGAEIGQRYRVELKPKDEATHKAFACIRTLHVLVTDEMRRMNELEMSTANAA